ncbi:MAG: hypothetical protein IPM07_15010 [Anaerolineales bacterium]|nr:hypothetical protein [Anaerolineales bacterium]
MSGVYGIADIHQIEDMACLLGAMTKSLTHYPWYLNDEYSDPVAGVGLARVGIGVFNRQPQPVHDASGAITLVFTGELTHSATLRSAVRQAGGQLRNETDEELLLAAYALWGAAAVEKLQGQFVLALLDRRSHELFLINDRFGLYPTYYSVDADRLIFAPEVKAVLTHQTVAPTLRDDALAEYFRFQRLLGTKTFFTGIELLPPAAILRFNIRTGATTLTRYWDMGQAPPVSPTISLDEAIEEGARLLTRATEDAMRGDWRIGVYLSGGLDSRAIAAMLAEQGCKLQTFTFGQPGCRDEHYARQIAAAIHAHHHYYPYHSGGWIEQFAPTHVRLAEGFHSWLHMHGINMLGDVRQHIDVNVSGLGDLLWPDANFTPPHLIGAPDDIAFSSILFELYHQKYSWPGLTYADERILYTDAYHPRLAGLAYDSFMTELSGYTHLPFSIRAAAFNLTNHFARHLVYHCVTGRSHVEYRLPYFDMALLTFAYGLPAHISMERRVQKGIIARYLPRVARIPATNDDLPIMEGVRSKRVAKLLKEVQQHATQFIAPASARRSSLYADYEGWLRTDLRSWAESILFDQRTLDRGIFSRAALTSLWSRHLGGNELWTVGKLASIITFEMTMRAFGQ